MSTDSGQRTLVLIQQNGQVLLGQKKRGFGAGRWNGFGGKLLPGETIDQAARREVREECGITVRDMEQRAVVTFTFAHDPLQLEMHIFSVKKFTGIPQETEEMAPRWFAIADIPYDQMWADDRHWLPLFLAGKSFVGHCHFADWHTVDQFTLNEVAPGQKPWHIAKVT